MNFLNLAALYLLFVFTYATPVFAVIGWIRKFLALQKVAIAWRDSLIWAALALVSVSDGIFWFITLARPFPEYYEDVKFYVLATLLMAALGLTIALLGKGKGRWWSVASAIGIPISWFMYGNSI